MNYGEAPFGLHAVRLVSGATVVDLEAARTMKFTPRLQSGELMGNDAIQAVAANIIALDWSLEEGGIPLEAYALITGWTLTESGSTPNRINTLPFELGTAMPWFKIYAQVLGGEGTDDLHVLIYRAKVTSIDGQFQGGQFYVTSMTGVALRDSGGDFVEAIAHETSADLPAS